MLEVGLFQVTVNIQVKIWNELVMHCFNFSQEGMQTIGRGQGHKLYHGGKRSSTERT